MVFHLTLIYPAQGAAPEFHSLVGLDQQANTIQVYVLLSAKREPSIASQALLDHLLKYSTEDFEWGTVLRL